MGGDRPVVLRCRVVSNSFSRTVRANESGAIANELNVFQAKNLLASLGETALSENWGTRNDTQEFSAIKQNKMG